jgi:hypothetical protein
LNDGECDDEKGFQGGNTVFFARNGLLDHEYQCIPKTGKVLIFDHGLLHSGQKLNKGRKYCIRTDISV